MANLLLFGYLFAGRKNESIQRNDMNDLIDDQIRSRFSFKRESILCIDISQAFQQLKLKQFSMSLCFMQIKIQSLYKPGNILHQLSA